MPSTLELLSPAGDAEIGIAAIDHGADAVYIGAPQFSARAQAGVGVADIARLVQHAHLYCAKVYVALNTILTNEELDEARDIAHEVFRLGVDGLIIQDFGLLELDLPPIPLIASTQMHNDTAEKVRFLEDIGFTRVILARELSIKEIAEIRAETSIELEVFVHGALCVSYSGQCYMSQAAAGRSGNRGVCAQPCRSPYTLTDADGHVLQKEKFLLSLKDLNLMNAIPDLVAAGVTSFKIEGRYKGIEYVKNVTAAYRQSIDRFVEDHPTFRRSSSGASTLTFVPDPDRTFNRGYTRYFSGGTRAKIGSIDTQKSIGQCVGTITGTGTDFFRFEGHVLQNGDGLCFFTNRHELAGFRVERIEQENVFPNSMRGLKTGILLYRNHDVAFERLLKKPSARRAIAVGFHLLRDGGSVLLTATDEDGNQAEARLDIPFEPERDPGSAKAALEKHLRRTGNTPYLVESVTTTPEHPGFLPISLLNTIRRSVLDALTRNRLDKYPRQIAQLVANDVPYPEKRLDYRGNVMNEKARRFYERHGTVVAERAFETLKHTKMIGKKVMVTRYCIRHQLGLCQKPRKLSPRVPNGPLRINDAHHTYRLEFDCRICQMSVILEGDLRCKGKAPR